MNKQMSGASVSLLLLCPCVLVGLSRTFHPATQPPPRPHMWLEAAPRSGNNFDSATIYHSQFNHLSAKKVSLHTDVRM